MNRTFRPLAGLTLVIFASVGCMTTSPSMETATGALAVDGAVESYPAYIDSSWNYHEAGSSYVFKSYNVGDEEVDELTFFHVAGETEKEKEVLEFRKKTNMSSLMGWTTTGVGIGAALAGVGLYTVYGADDTDAFVATPLGQASFGLMAAGGVVVGLSFYVAILFGPDRPLNRHDLVLDPTSDGQDAADRGNARRLGEPVSGEPAAEPAPETPTE
jgi:hypothetical protein